jgi:hypothetical protein
MSLKLHIFLGILVVSSAAIALASAEQEFSLSSCKRECAAERNVERAACIDAFIECTATCSGQTCKRSCTVQKNSCIAVATAEQTICSKICTYIAQGKLTTCLNGTYRIGETFADGCEQCMCAVNGIVSCKKTPFCNFNNVSIGKELCVSSGGLFHALCNGPYFDIVCSSKKFCLCGGTNEYQCPLNHECIQDFISPNKRIHTIDGWKNLLGQDLGTIGVCAQNPELPTCGDGVCENRICKNCAPPETRFSCPNDCAP